MRAHIQHQYWCIPLNRCLGSSAHLRPNHLPPRQCKIDKHYKWVESYWSTHSNAPTMTVYKWQKRLSAPTKIAPPPWINPSRRFHLISYGTSFAGFWRYCVRSSHPLCSDIAHCIHSECSLSFSLSLLRKSFSSRLPVIWLYVSAERNCTYVTYIFRRQTDKFAVLSSARRSLYTWCAPHSLSHFSVDSLIRKALSNRWSRRKHCLT